jgi:hypothetical protein
MESLCHFQQTINLSLLETVHAEVVVMNVHAAFPGDKIAVTSFLANIKM